MSNLPLFFLQCRWDRQFKNSPHFGIYRRGLFLIRKKFDAAKKHDTSPEDWKRIV